MSRNAGGFLHRFFRLSLALLYVLGFWAALKYPVYADTTYYIGAGSAPGGQFHESHIGPDSDDYSTWFNDGIDLCEALALPYKSDVINLGLNDLQILPAYQETFIELGATGTPDQYVQVGFCQIEYTYDNGTGSPQAASFNLSVYAITCLSGLTPQYAPPGSGARYMTCSPPIDCSSWASTYPPIQGYLTMQFPTPAAYCRALNPDDPLADDCQYDYHVRETIYSQEITVGHNVTLTPTANLCPDVEPIMWIQNPLPADETNNPDPGEDVVGGPENPNQETSGGGAVDQAPDPTAPDDQVDPEQITQSEELLQEMVKRAQELNTQMAQNLEQNDDVNDELNFQTDLLSKILNQLGNNEGDNKSASSPMDCEQPMNCLGDPIFCALLQEQRRTRCDDYFHDLPDALETMTAYEQNSNDFVAGTQFDLEGVIDDTARYSSSCPVPEVFAAFGHSFQISYDPLCSLAPSIKPWVLMAGYFTACLILFRAF